MTPAAKTALFLSLIMLGFGPAAGAGKPTPTGRKTGTKPGTATSATKPLQPKPAKPPKIKLTPRLTTPPMDISTRDIAGRSFRTRDQRGKVFVIYVSPRTAKRATEMLCHQIGWRYDATGKFGWAVVADVTTVPRIFRFIARSVIKGHYKRVIREVRAEGKRRGLPPDPALKRKVRFIPDFKGNLVRRLGEKPGSKKFRIVALNFDGRVLGRYGTSPSEIKRLFATLDPLLLKGKRK